MTLVNGDVWFKKKTFFLWQMKIAGSTNDEHKKKNTHKFMNKKRLELSDTLDGERKGRSTFNRDVIGFL